MTRGLTIGQYYPSGSFVHRIDPRVKLVLATFFSVVAILIENLAGLVSVFIAIIMLLVAARIPIRAIVKGLRPLSYILFSSFLIQAFAGSGPWVVLGPVRLSKPGLFIGAFVTARILLLIVGVSFLSLTATPVEVSDAFGRLILPLKRIGVPVHEIAMSVMIALRFVPTFTLETDKIIMAQAARGASFNSGSVLKRARNVISVIVPLFVNVFRRSDELAEAIDARAYRGGTRRTRMKELALTPVDIGSLLIGMIVLAGIIWIGR